MAYPESTPQAQAPSPSGVDTGSSNLDECFQRIIDENLNPDQLRDLAAMLQNAADEQDGGTENENKEQMGAEEGAAGEADAGSKPSAGPQMFTGTPD